MKKLKQIYLITITFLLIASSAFSQINNETYFAKEQEKATWKLGAIIGGSITQISFNIFNPNITFENLNTSNNITAGLSLNIILPRNRGKWSVYNELLYTSFNVSERFNNYTFEEYYDIFTVTLDYSYIKLNTMIRFKHSMNNVSLLFNAGISNAFVVTSTSNCKREHYLLPFVAEKKIPGLTSKHELGYILGCGVQYKKISIELRYEKSTGMSTLASQSSPIKRYYALLGYTF